VPARSIAELVALIRANPGKFSYASPGTGTPPHLLGELFRLSLSLDLVHVPFNGGGPAVASTVAGHTPISFGGVPPAAPHIKQGLLRALAVASLRRAQVLPEVPTMAEAGYGDVEGGGWWAILVPAGTPAATVALLHREIAAALALPDMQERLAALGYETIASAPAASADHIKSEIARWAKVIRDAGIKAQ
jgi:tripartite-type tricarboxylate transporter receptor subunit TctC